MTARCPQCRTRYRIERERMAPRGAQLRCTRCKTVFRVEATSPAERMLSGLVERGSSRGREERDPELEVAARPMSRTVRALVAERDRAIARRTADALERFGIDTELVHEGADALLRIFRTRPPLAVLGTGLSGVGSPTIAELVRRTRELARVRLIRITSADEPGGPPEFEADETLQAPDLAAEIGRVLERLGLIDPGAGSAPPAGRERRRVPRSSGKAAPSPDRRKPVERVEEATVIVEAEPEPEPEPERRPEWRRRSSDARPRATASEPEAVAEAAPVAKEPPARTRRSAAARPEGQTERLPEPAVASPDLENPDIQAAQRLARIAVSDIILYNEERFRSAAAAGKLPEALQPELDEARQLFKQRVAEPLRAERDFLVEELMRRASKLAS